MSVGVLRLRAAGAALVLAAVLPSAGRGEDPGVLARKPSIGAPSTAEMKAEAACGQVSTLACPSSSSSGALTADDCVAPDGSFFDVWQFTGSAGQIAAILMSSTAFDTYLILVNPSGIVAAQNDDASSGTTDSKIVFTLNASGTWSIRANSLAAGQLGAYNLELACSPATGTTFRYDFPVAAHVTGATGTPFVSDVQLINGTLSPAAVTLQFFETSSVGRNGPTSTATVTVPAGAQAVLNDVLATSLNVPNGLGALRVISDQALTAAERMFNDRRGAGAGTNGFSFPAKAPSQYKSGATLPFLSQASAADLAAGLGFRTNIGYFNPSSVAIAVAFQAYAASGALLGSVNVTIPPFAMAQQPAFSLLSTVPEGSRVQQNFYVTWTSSSPLLIYAAVADNKTDDVVYVD